jgi:hypothetical protein
MTPQIDKIKKPWLKEMAIETTTWTDGNFGMMVESGVDLDALAAKIIVKCKDAISKTDPTTAQRALDAINKEFGIK